jgi:hypothetical protein
MPQTCGYCRSPIADGDAFCQTCGRRATPAPSYTPDGRAMEQPEPAVAALPGLAGRSSWGTDGPGLPPAVTAMGPGASAAAGEAGVNTSYVGRRLMYETDPEPSFDPLGNPQFLRQMWYRGLLYGWVWGVGIVAAGIVFGLMSLIIPPLGIILLILSFIAISVTLLACYWFLKIPIKLSEWKYSVDGKAAAAPAVLDHIAWVLRGRGAPLTSVTVRRLTPPGGEPPRDYLELNSTIFYGYVACFAYGSDLYVGWTFWVRISPFWYFCMSFMRIWQSLRNRGNELYTSLRFDTARAMRETMHSATREGADVAVGRLAGQGRGIIGSAVPIVESAG